MSDANPSSPSDRAAERRRRLAASRLYLVCGRAPGRRALAEVLPDAIANGVDVVQLREKDLDPGEPGQRRLLLDAARSARELCAEHGALFVLNDFPELAVEAGADGVHVGQEDMPVARAREIVGPEMLLGLSTHAPVEIDAVDPALVDYIGVGPVHATPTKPGRPAVGVELVRHATAHARVPFFAIGGLHAGNLGEVRAAGATRVCVLRALANARDPERAARELRAVLDGDRPRGG